MKKIYINADDYGSTPGVSYGMYEAFDQGIITSATMLATTEWFDHGVRLHNLKGKKLDLGIHLTLTYGKALTKNKLLSDAEGNFIRPFYKELSDLDAKISDEYVEEVREEWGAQFDKLIQSGIEITHIDSHHHVHLLNEKLYALAVEFSKKYKIPIRRSFSAIDLKPGIGPSAHVEIYDTRRSIEYVDGVMESNADDIEVSCHVAFIDEVLSSSSGYIQGRLDDWKFLKQLRDEKYFENRGYKVCTYKEFNYE